MTDATDWVRPILVGAAGTVVVALLAILVARSEPDRAGWRQLTPSAMHWTGVVLGGGLVLLMSYVRLFVGSSRADAESQMAILTGLILCFAAGTLIVALATAGIRRQAMRCRGPRLNWRKAGKWQEAALGDICRVERDILGYTVLLFVDGCQVKVDPYAKGAAQLIDAACEAAARHRDEKG